MPRLPPQLLRRAARISPNIATLLPACRDIGSAQNELRWLTEHVHATTSVERRQSHLNQLCRRRGRGVPLQYVLGSQPFGSLDILCKPGVLIPRPETEAYTCHLLELLKSGTLLGQRAASVESLRVIDFCTGTGCIPLLLFSSLQRVVRSLDVRGMDISPIALELSRSNVSHNIAQGYMRASDETRWLSFEYGDVFQDADIQRLASNGCDVMISNPPYVSKDVWDHGRGQLGYSVRKNEPRLALVPGAHLPAAPNGLNPEDIFYARLLDITSILKPKVLLMEIGDSEQAFRVVEYCAKHTLCAEAEVEIWRDWPDLQPAEDEQTHFKVRSEDGSENTVSIKGSGNIRSILLKLPQ